MAASGTTAGPENYAPTQQSPVVNTPQPAQTLAATSAAPTTLPAPAPSEPPATVRPQPQHAGHLALPILACLCFLPAGIWSVMEAQQARAHCDAGDQSAANRSLRLARTIALAGIGVGLAIVVIVLAVVLAR